MDELVVEKKRPLEAGSEEEEAASKRPRREDGEEKEAASSSSCGFPRILELEQEEEEDERGIQQEDVTDVMRSLERELGVESSSSGEAEPSSSSSQSPTPSPSSSRLDLGFLLEASDDELGIGDDDSGSGSGLDCVDDTALVEEEDLARGDSWSDGDWVAACSGLEDEQQWVRRSIEMFLASPCSSTQPAFEAAPLLIEL